MRLRLTCRAMLPLMVAMPALTRSGGEIVELDLEAGECGNMGNPAAHLSRADHPDLAN